MTRSSAGDFKQFRTVFKFELQGYLKNKMFVGLTILFVIAAGIVMFSPRILSLFNLDLGAILNRQANISTSVSTNSKNADTGKLPIILVMSDMPGSDEYVREAFASKFNGYHVVMTHDTLDSIREKVKSGQVVRAFVVHGFNSYTYFVKNDSFFDRKYTKADEALKHFAQTFAMAQNGMSREQIKAVMSPSVTHTVEAVADNPGKAQDQMRGTLFAVLVGMMLLYSAIFYGQMIVANVAAEKGTRVMEVLLTSVRPKNMIFGKVMAAFIAIFVQLFFAGATLIICYNFNREGWKSVPLVTAVLDTPFSILAYAVIFFLLGFLLYAFLFGMFGSFISKFEDIEASNPYGIGMVIAVIGFVFSLFLSFTADFQAMPAVIGSLIPFCAPQVMLLRIATGAAPFYQIMLSMGILIASIILIGIFAAKVYRVGVLLTGEKHRISTILWALRETDKKARRKA